MEEKNKKRLDGSIYMSLHIIREKAARVALRWVGFFGCVRIFFFPASVSKCRFTSHHSKSFYRQGRRR